MLAAALGTYPDTSKHVRVFATMTTNMAELFGFLRGLIRASRLCLCGWPLGGARICVSVDVREAQLRSTLANPLLLDRGFVLLHDEIHCICGCHICTSLPMLGARSSLGCG